VTLEAPARSLRPFATPAGAICALALDHRDAMRNAYKRIGVEEVSETTMLDVKARIVDALADTVSAMLLDAPAVARCRPAGVGVFVPLETQGHQPLAGGRLTGLLDGFGPADAAALGVEGCKLLLYYRSDHDETAPRQRALLEAVAADCHRHGLPLVVEPLVYRLDDEDEHVYARRFGELVVSAARDLADSGADLLKLQFPGDADACERVSWAASPLPWTLLGGADIAGEAFAEQLRVACRAGACGFIAGRAIWGGALALEASEQSPWLRDHARPLLQRLADIADTHARRIH
jgi:tagatose-1,6-bisphosphate aldolase